MKASEPWPQSWRDLVEDAVERGAIDGQWLHAAQMWIAFEDRNAHAQKAETDSLTRDAMRYRWLRDGNSYAPEEAMVRGGDELDSLCDAGIDAPQPTGN